MTLLEIMAMDEAELCAAAAKVMGWEQREGDWFEGAVKWKGTALVSQTGTARLVVPDFTNPCECELIAQWARTLDAMGQAAFAVAINICADTRVGLTVRFLVIHVEPIDWVRAVVLYGEKMTP
jgi:hypothetical protein